MYRTDSKVDIDLFRPYWHSLHHAKTWDQRNSRAQIMHSTSLFEQSQAVSSHAKSIDSSILIFMYLYTDLVALFQ